MRKALQKDNCQNVDLVKLLLELITENVSVVAKNNQPFLVTDKYASDLINQKVGVRKYLQIAAETKTVVEAASDYFTDGVIPLLIKERIADLVICLMDIIESDDAIRQETKTMFAELAKENDLAAFLSEVFLYALRQPNHYCDDQKKQIPVDLDQTLQKLHELKQQYESVPKPEQVLVPDDPVLDEMNYVNALLEAYGDAEKICFTKGMLSGYLKYDNHFKRSRKEYYSAESVRRGVRDIFEESNEETFESLKEETYNSIIDVQCKDYSNGYVRLLEVMSHVTTVSLDNCFLSELKGWIGSNEKKGVCHVLVNDNRIKWVINE